MTYGVVTDPTRDGQASQEVRVLAATYSGKRRVPRFGGVAAATVADDRFTTARAGGIVGYGAPWNDVLVGAVVEAGVMGARPIGVTPYAGLSFILQIPIPTPVRPIVGFSTYWAPLFDDYPVVASFDAGLVWQAW